MNANFQTTGIILQKKPFGENDLLISFLSPELGLKKAIAPNGRLYKSTLRGRTELLMVNDFFLIKGRNLDRILQIEGQISYGQLNSNIGKLTISQYLAELVLHLAHEQPQKELYMLFLEHLRRIDSLTDNEKLFAYLAQAVFHLLAISGIAPEIYHCVHNQRQIQPNFEQPYWRVGFTFQGGGVTEYFKSSYSSHYYQINDHLNAVELALLQSLPKPSLLSDLREIIPFNCDDLVIQKSWMRIERILKNYLEFHLDCKMRSAEVIADILIGF
ncbi:DNA repair protein RecO [Cyanobacterium aponinum]|uniref:DNA repair protein RecO n=1 Tax=Cyanobacterium aponinum TaxID=379064 RepID=UPI000C12BA92|nr:DNA repair protein RecO [Cyanobacterium aponinum]PHV62019.1 DNA repair protein RecO [Cyanobacterium aponinum IPPAS B-1201]